MGWKGQRGDIGEADLSVGQEGRVVRHDGASGAGRETKEHSRDSSGKGNGGQEAWGRGSKVTSEPDRELDPGH